MCCDNQPKLYNAAVRGRSPEDWMYGYKWYDLVRGADGKTWKFITPYKGAPLNLDSQQVLPVGVHPAVNPAKFDFLVCGQAVHFSRTKEHALDIASPAYPGYCAKVFVQVKDILGVDTDTAAARRLIIDIADLMEMRKIIASRRGK